MNPMDTAIKNDFLMISKSLVPYLSADKQKSAAIFIKALELVYTVNLFSQEEFVRSFSRSQESGWEKNLLSDIRTDLSDDRGYFIDAILKISEAKEILTAKKNGDEATFPKNTTSKMSSDIPHNSKTIHTHNANSNSNPNSNNPTQILSSLSGVLEPNQLQLLKVLSAFMK